MGVYKGLLIWNPEPHHMHPEPHTHTMYIRKQQGAPVKSHLSITKCWPGCSRKRKRKLKQHKTIAFFFFSGQVCFCLGLFVWVSWLVFKISLPKKLLNFKCACIALKKKRPTLTHSLYLLLQLQTGITSLCLGSAVL